MFQVLQCAASSSESRCPSDGFKEVWDRAQQAGQCSLQAAIASIRGVLEAGEGVQRSGQQMDSGQGK